MTKPTLPCSDAEALACVGRIVASQGFARAERQKRFLRYLVEQTLAGKARSLKGYTIGIEVFDRPADFDPAVDASVRVQAGQLRAKLREYYGGEGRADPICIDVPKGSYAVSIATRQAAPQRPVIRHGPAAASNGPESAGADAPVRDKASIAVLPFANMSSDAQQGHFADGITEDLTTELSKLSGLFVISRHSAFVYRNAAKSAEEISRELGVRYLVEGSVRRAGAQLRISARLVDAVLGGHVWAERYDHEIEDIFAVQDNVIHRIVEVLHVTLLRDEAERIGVAGTRSLAAYEAVLRSREQAFRFTHEANQAAKEHCRRALQIDPSYANAYAELARAWVGDWVMDWTSDAQVLEAAFDHARKATELDPGLALAHALLGFVQLWRRQGTAAIQAGQRAVELDPNNAEARMYLCYSFAAINRAQEGLLHIETALRLHPHRSALYMYALGLCHYLLYDYGKATLALEQAIEANPSFTPHVSLLAKLYTLTGRPDDARRARQRVLDAGGRGSFPSTFYIDPELAIRAERDRKLAWGE